MMGKLHYKQPLKGEFRAIGNIFNIAKLSEREYNIWSQLNTIKSEKEWIERCIDKKLIKNKKELNQYKEKFTKNHILIDFSFTSINDSILKKYLIIKNGVSVGFSDKERKWIINSYNPNGGGVGLTQEEYDVWISSSGVCTIYDTIINLIDRQKIDENTAISLFMGHVYKLNRAGLWTIEYIEDVKESDAFNKGRKIVDESKYFSPNELKEDLKIIALGEEFGEPRIEKKVVLGNQMVDIEHEELLVWLLCKKKDASISNIKNILGVKSEVINKIVKELMRKRLVMIWPEVWSEDEHFIVSASAVGTSLGYINKQYIIKDFTIGELQFLSLQAYLVWMNSQALIPLGFTVRIIKDILNITETSAKQTLSQAIPYLVEKGLVNLHIIPNEASVKGV
ncbi:hypothetical protein J6TS2_23510 [Heyndrickxia sporothermodurans]|nr:hypothetical protein J6TS2_23510 [Heyndrickxia sporothermodurans]